MTAVARDLAVGIAGGIITYGLQEWFGGFNGAAQWLLACGAALIFAAGALLLSKTRAKRGPAPSGVLSDIRSTRGVSIRRLRSRTTGGSTRLLSGIRSRGPVVFEDIDVEHKSDET
jgi:hypothetical protein